LRAQGATISAWIGQMPAFDVVVVGLGAMGGAALYHLARRGVRVVGIERFELGHEFGSSHGATRIIRLGHYEHPSAVPLLRRAYELWRELETASGRTLIYITGIAEIGPPEGILVRGTLTAAHTHLLPYEFLDAEALMRRIPPFRLPKHYVGVIQPDGGFIEAGVAINVHVQLAISAGASLRANEKVLAVKERAGGVRIETDRCSVDADAVIVTAGPWTKTLLPDLPASLRVTRQVVGWFEPNDAALFAADRFPVFLLESRHGMHFGFPLHGESGIKIAKHHHLNETVHPDSYNRAVTVEDEAVISAAIAEHIPAANGRLLAAKTCLYTMTPDGAFIIDHLPKCSQILIASPCCGHGFKFAPVIGEIIADLVTTGTTRHDISAYRLGRFRQGPDLTR
jgi:sarcosine oxidase